MGEMRVIRWLLFSFLFGVTYYVFSQADTAKDIFFETLSRKVYTNHVDFQKAQKFYISKDWDSTLVYSLKELNSGSDNELADYCHYFRGYSFAEKKLFGEAIKEYDLVSAKFPFYYRVKIELGEIALEQNLYEKSLHYFLEVEKTSNNNTYAFKRSALYHNIGLCYFHLAQFDKAEEYFIKSTTLLKIEEDKEMLVVAYMDMANLYYEQYKDHLAIPYFEKAYQLSKKLNSFDIKRRAAKNMSVVEENRKNFSQALIYRKEAEIWKDSLNDQNKIWDIAALEKKLAIEQKQKEIGILESENKLKVAERNGFVFSSVLLLLLLGTGVYFYLQKSKANKIILAQKVELDRLNATKDKLFSIVSHDLRSSVNALKTSNIKLKKGIEERDYESLDKAIHKNGAIAGSVYNLLDNLLQWASIQTQQLYFSIETIDLHAVVEQMEYNYSSIFAFKGIVFENKMSKAVFVTADLDSVKIILRNLIDNAIKFSGENSKVSVYIRPSEDAFCYLVVEDSGIGIDEITLNELLNESPLLMKKKDQTGIGTGLGLQLCKSMINKNNGKLFIESIEGKGTKMIVVLPANA